MIDAKYLRKNFLVASPVLDDAVFEHSVIYIYEHNEEGSVGVIINKPMHVNLLDVLKHTTSKIDAVDDNLVDETVLLGGAAQQDSGLIVYYDEQNKCIDMATSLEMLDNIAKGLGPKQRVIALGYCAWDAGQLEQEILFDDWLVMPADPEVLFEVPVQLRWHECMKRMGVDDITHYSGDSGNA